jgi:aflatoxin B1 aldehyde reductase
MSRQHPQIIFGGGSIGFSNLSNEFGDAEGATKAVSVLKKGGVTVIDTARAYGRSEAILGEIKAGTDLGCTLDTKWAPSFFPGARPLTKEIIVSDAKDSIAKLGVKQVDVFYMHGPETNVSFEEQLEGVDEVYKLGLFKRFGISNYSSQQVQEIIDLAEKKGYVKPSVFQGLYSPVNRNAEAVLLPLLKKLGIAFRAYSPIAGGFLTKTRAGIEAGEGRANMEGIGAMYVELYHKPQYLDALDEWARIADEEGVNKAELALRWTQFHSALKGKDGDGLIFGAPSSEKIQSTLEYLKKGPLSAKAVNAIEEIWKLVESVSYENNLLAAAKAMGF